MKYLTLYKNFKDVVSRPDRLSGVGCGCCQDCTGDRDCKCGCDECSCMDSEHSNNIPYRLNNQLKK